MQMKKIIKTIVLCGLLALSGCNKFMDVVPDNVAELDQAFSMRTMAERFLFTCYSWLPRGNEFAENAALLAGDEFWLNSTTNFGQGSWPNWYIAMGGQNVNSPLLNYWDGNTGGMPLWRGIRECNIFLENIDRVPDMDQLEKDRWAAEVTFLKAYYHYYLLRMYGPIPIVDENIPTFEDPENVFYERQPIDEVFAYIVGKIDGAMPALMEDVMQPAQETGRVTQVVAKAMKAEMLVTAASPLFNGNTDYPNYTNAAGQPLFNATYDAGKWQLAATACLAAIQAAEAVGKRLYRWVPPSNMLVTPQQSTINQMSIRQAVTERENNPESIWVNNRSSALNSQGTAFMPRSVDPARVNNNATGGYMAPTLNMVLKFYSKNGVPIEEDYTWDYENRFELREVPLGESPYQYNLVPGHTTVGLHFDREDRFYGALAFDGGRYFMSNHTDDLQAYTLNSLPGGNTAATNSPTSYSGTGYTPKKLVSYFNVIGEQQGSFTAYGYPFVMMRLGNLYLLYAEALNEVNGPTEEVYAYLDRIRERSGLGGVLESWSDYSTNPQKPYSKDGLREIIHQERTIELAFESQRFWDLRRWKRAQEELNTPIYGWDILQQEPQTYYRRVVMYTRSFTLRDYFWPISINELRRNSNLLQSPLW